MRRIFNALVIILIMSMISACGSSSSSDDINETKTISDSSTKGIAETEDKEPESADNPTESKANTIEEENNYWNVTAETDEFGDIKENGELGLSAIVKGDFSNTATSSSDLLVKIHLIMMSEDRPVFIFDMYEYGDNPIDYLQSEQKAMKIKAEDEISNIYLDTFDGFRGVCTGFTKGQNEGYQIHHYLRKGEDVRCIIEIGSSKYNFTLESANYVEAFNAAFPDESIPIKEESSSVSLDKAQVGDYISYGKNENGNTISWKVIDSKDGKLLVISENLIGQRPFFSEYSEDGDWSNSSLRAWLNEDFIQSSFSEDETSLIVDSEISSRSGKTDVTTTDKVFILSCEEAETYFSNDAERSEGVMETWLLRDVLTRHSEPWKTLQMNYVRDNGEILDYPIHEGDELGIRPAMWLNIE